MNYYGSVQCMLVRKLFAALLLSVLASLCIAQPQDSLIILKSEANVLDDILEGICQEIEKDMQVTVLAVSGKTKLSALHKQILMKPNLIVTIGNDALRRYIDYQNKYAKSKAFPPALVLGALYVEYTLPKLKNATGISYEIPAVSGIVALRSLAANPIKRVGVIYRDWLSESIEANSDYARAEGAQLIGFRMNNKPRNVGRALRQVFSDIEKDDVDAIWVVNDSLLINAELVNTVWAPQLRELAVPVIVGTESLVSTELAFGNFAVYPDHENLAFQAANRIYDIKYNQWRIETQGRIDRPLSVIKAINRDLMRINRIDITDKNIGEVDIVIDE